MTARRLNSEETVVESGPASASVVCAYWDGAAFLDVGESAAAALDVPVGHLLFLSDLSNGGERGAGRRVLEAALALAARRGRTLVVEVVSADPAGQSRLVRWYESTGLLQRVTVPGDVFVGRRSTLETDIERRRR